MGQVKLLIVGIIIFISVVFYIFKPTIKTEYYESGDVYRIIKIGKYKERIHIKEYDINRKLLKEVCTQNGSVTKTKFYSEFGFVRSIVDYNSNIENWKYFNENGELVATTKFNDGKREGLAVSYHNNGLTKAENYFENDCLLLKKLYNYKSNNELDSIYQTFFPYIELLNFEGKQTNEGDTINITFSFPIGDLGSDSRSEYYMKFSFVDSVNYDMLPNFDFSERVYAEQRTVSFVYEPMTQAQYYMIGYLEIDGVSQEVFSHPIKYN